MIYAHCTETIARKTSFPWRRYARTENNVTELTNQKGLPYMHCFP